MQDDHIREVKMLSTCNDFRNQHEVVNMHVFIPVGYLKNTDVSGVSLHRRSNIRGPRATPASKSTKYDTFSVFLPIT